MKKTKRIMMLVIAIMLTLGGVYLYERQFMDKQIENVFDEMYYSGAPEWTGYKIKREVSWGRTKCVKRTERGIKLIDDSQREKFIDSCLPNEITFSNITYYQDENMSITMVKKISDKENLIFGYLYSVNEKVMQPTLRYNDSTDSSVAQDIMEVYYAKYQTNEKEVLDYFNKIFYQELLPIYFENNNGKSAYSIENLGNYTIVNEVRL